MTTKELKTNPKNEVVLVGHIGVDAGLCWLGDPCYIMHTDKPPKAIGEDWGEFCNTIDDDKHPTMQSYNFDMGHEGLGVLVSSGIGDGLYPVYAEVEELKNWGKRVKKVWVEFFEDE